MVTVGSIWSGTFRFVRANLASVVVWSGVLIAISLVSTLAMAPIYQARLAAIQSGTPAAPNFGRFLLMVLIGLVLFVVLWAAVLRAVMFPEERRFAYMRLGMDELRLFGAMLALYFGGYVIVLIAAAILIGITYALLGVWGAFGGGLLLFCAVVWAVVRVSPAGPLTILQRKIVIGPAWRLTRGAFWRLFGAYLLLGLLLIVIYGSVVAIQIGPVLSDMLHPTDPAAAARVAQWQLDHYSALSPRAIGVAVVGGIVGGFALAFQAGITAIATRDLLGLSGTDLTRVFE